MALSTTKLTPEALQARLLYRDGLALVIDKPAGLPVHGGPGGGPNLEASFDALRFGLPRPPALAHRLDRDTSGCLLLGRHPKALRRLGKLFAAGGVEKIYWAITRLQPAELQGRIALALRKETRKNGWQMRIDAGGQSAVTDYRWLGGGDGFHWIECRPQTGRTHQIRVHLAAIGCPILGDPIYGSAEETDRGRAPLHLHARALTFKLYPAKPPIHVEAPPPDHMRAALKACGWSEKPAG